MAYSRRYLSGAALAAHDLNVPLVLAAHELRDYHAALTTGGIWSTTGTVGSTDGTETGYPCTRAYDGFAHKHTKPDANGATWYLVFDLSLAPIAFDSVFIVAQALKTDAVVTVQIADNSAFSTNLHDAVVFSVGGAYGFGTAALVSDGATIVQRMASAKLGAGGSAPSAYSSVSYLRLKCYGGSTNRPQVAELILGSRRQLHYWPSLPYDDLQSASEIDGGDRSPVGVDAVVPRFAGASARSLSLDLGSAAENAVASGIWSDSDGGRHPVVLMTSPNTGAVAELMAFDAESIDYDPQRIGPGHRDVAYDLVEMHPLRSQD